jgi:hypothetical protein
MLRITRTPVRPMATLIDLRSTLGRTNRDVGRGGASSSRRSPTVLRLGLVGLCCTSKTWHLRIARNIWARRALSSALKGWPGTGPDVRETAMSDLGQVLRGALAEGGRTLGPLAGGLSVLLM